MEDLGTVIKDNTVKESDMEQKLRARAAQLAASMRVSENISPSVIASWQDQVKNLLELANSAGISIDIASLQAQLASVESEVGFEKSKAILDLYSLDNRALSATDQAEIKKMEDFHKEGLRLENNHQKIMVDVGKYLEKKKKETQELSNIADLIDEKNQKGEDVDPDILKPLIKSPEQIRAQILEEIEHKKKFRQHKKEVDDHNKAVHTHNNDLKAEKAKLVEHDLKEPKQIADPAELARINNEKTEKIKLYDQQIKKSDIEVKKSDKQKEELEKAAREREQELEKVRQNNARMREMLSKIKQKEVQDKLLSDWDKRLEQEKEIATKVAERLGGIDVTNFLSAGSTDQNQEISDKASFLGDTISIANKMRNKVEIVHITGGSKTSITADPTPVTPVKKSNIGPSQNI